LGLTILAQTAGLMTTTATKSAFLTSLYVIFVPLLNGLFFGVPLTKDLVGSLLLALIGSILLTQNESANFLDLFTGFGIGELLTMACAVFASLQIISISVLSKKIENAFVFNIWSSLWTSLCSIPLLFLFPQSKFDIKALNPKSLFAIASLTLFSTVLAFSLQVRNQKKINANVASLIFLMESPFAFILAYLLLGESVTITQAIGMVSILGSVVLTILKNY
jgi:drug/metabolite transporter (DMT)-like permease